MQRLWSVTALMSAGLPKEALVGWAAKVVAQFAVNEHASWCGLAERDPEAAIDLLKGARYRTQNRAADRGTDIHKVMEALALGVTPPDHDHPHVAQLERFFAEHEPEFEVSEATAYNTEFNYAGTLDGIVTFRKGPLEGQRGIIDAKTTDKSIDERTTPPYPDVAIQTVAYARSTYLGVAAPEMSYSGQKRYYLWDPERVSHEPMPQVDKAWALVVFPDGYKLVPLDIGDATWQGFLAVREVARWTLATSRTVLGKPVSLDDDTQQELPGF